MTAIDNSDYFEDLACHLMLLAEPYVEMCGERLPTKEAVESLGERLDMIADVIKAGAKEMREGTFFLSRQN